MPSSSQARPAGWRIVIAGGGIAGLSLALALKGALGPALEVVVCDPILARDPSGDRRAYAIAAAARRMLEALGIWPKIVFQAQPMLSMVVTDSRLDDPVRPTFLAFDGEVEAGEPFAHMVESGALTAALMEGCRAGGVALEAVGVSGFAPSPDAVEVRLADGRSLDGALLGEAGGARSRLR